MKLSLSKSESLKNKKDIAFLFQHGKVVKQYPILLKYQKIDLSENAPSIRFLFSVPKRNIKKAVHRNKIKRRLREVVRLNKRELLLLSQQKVIGLNIAVIYMAKDVENYELIQQSFIKSQRKLIYSIQNGSKN